MKKTLSLLAVAAFAGVQAGAAIITWGTPTFIQGDSDVSTEGTLVASVNANGTAVTVNGVDFDAPGGDIYVDGPGWADFTFTPSDVSLSPAYDTLLTSANYNGGGMAIGGLTSNQLYQVQIWANDSRDASASVGGRTVTLTAGNAVTLQENKNTTSATNTVGQWVIGTFVALGATQDISFSSNVSGGQVINAAQVRAIPEPATLGLVGLGSMVALFARRLRLR